MVVIFPKMPSIRDEDFLRTIRSYFAMIDNQRFRLAAHSPPAPLLLHVIITIRNLSHYKFCLYIPNRCHPSHRLKRLSK